MDTETRKKLDLTHPMHFLAVGFGSGLAVKMPGTFGTLAALPLVWVASLFPDEIFIALTVLVCLAGIKICDQTAKDLGVHDHSAIVWDEFAGLFITFLLVPFNPSTAIVGFLLFRFFDIVKPWPISLLDKKVKGGFGIMVDDIAAGVMACVVMHALLYFEFLTL
ncbi:phosphatidylglycerophosphatase A [Alteromonas sediminis]|uniref:Phosphatidylglycerophosphatase A n=1 Tax=Alteromonas sediminis TaxID=2259342 RepID=A0A3N5XXB2_9ALTE|nr:phosphatidylglycerophosphatase A [Alteromonas sediminis]RPJ65577.1 phosphatidylglycerophosphatase A [Alteromonas sediminis]